MKTLFFKTLILLSFLIFTAGCGEDQQNFVEPINVDFSYEADNLTVHFSHESENPATIIWDFGDNNSSADLSPQHTYAEFGEYLVNLIVISSNAETTSQISKTITLTDPCSDWVNMATGINLVNGGDFEICDSKYWTALHSGQKSKNGDYAYSKYDFGYTVYRPTDGNDGSLYIYPDNEDSDGAEGTIIYQEIDLEAGDYKISTLLKVSGEDPVYDNVLPMKGYYWCEFILNKEKPIEGDFYNHDVLMGFHPSWTGWGLTPPYDGSFPYDVYPGLVNSAGEFHLSESAKYYLVIRFGKSDDQESSFGEGMALDNLVISKLKD